MLELEQLSTAYIYLDLEVDRQDNIYRLGLETTVQEQDFSSDALEKAYKLLTCLKESGWSVCGHNFRRFDYPHLLKQVPKLKSWKIIDTLELSVLAFPLQPSHKLNKEYKLSDYSGNNPLEDALATRLLLRQCLAELLSKPQSVQQVYGWLLSCAEQEADRAYRQLFGEKLGICTEAPALETLPSSMLEGLDYAYLEQVWSESKTDDFDKRLCLAALLAWNYETNQSRSSQTVSNWLTRLPGFEEVLNGLRPLKSDQLTLSTYLKPFGKTGFRSLQEQTIRALLSGERPLVILPTGGGKSLCYQLPALMLFEQQKALTVVISPLQALMADQVAELEADGLDFATYINGTLLATERRGCSKT